MATSWGQLGDIENVRGNWDAAERLFQQSLQLREELGDRSGIAKANWALAQLYRAKNNPALAQQHYTTAHQLFTQLGAKKDLENIEKELGMEN